jgi:hypothetical protein
MGFFSHIYYPWGIILQGLALIHYFRRRPAFWWFYVIIFLFPPLGAAIYLIVEAVPDFGLLRKSFKVFPRRKRIRELEAAVRVNPSAGNFEELADLLMDDGKLALARAAFDRTIAAQPNTLDPYYRRGVCALELGDPAAALPDLDRVVQKEPDYDFDRAQGLLAQALALTGDPTRAEALFRRATAAATLSETYLNFAVFLASTGRPAEAREWAQRVIDKSVGLPNYQRRRERPWVRRARKLLKQLPA